MKSPFEHKTYRVDPLKIPKMKIWSATIISSINTIMEFAGEKALEDLSNLEEEQLLEYAIRIKSDDVLWNKIPESFDVGERRVFKDDLQSYLDERIDEYKELFK